VYHPALEGNPGHAIWRRDFSGSSSLFSFALPRAADPKSFLNALEIFGLGYSYGGYESLAVQVGLSDRIVRRPDFEMSIIRLQVALEDVND
uniref:PLP-dependent transferase n=1 Tax=Klebsiella pneumoniae TaxID=573 RepID=UPI0019547252